MTERVRVLCVGAWVSLKKGDVGGDPCCLSGVRRRAGVDRGSVGSGTGVEAGCSESYVGSRVKERV